MSKYDLHGACDTSEKWNYNKFDRITLGTENRSSWILAIRSYYLTINTKEYMYSFVYNNPVLKH